MNMNALKSSLNLILIGNLLLTSCPIEAASLKSQPAFLNTQTQFTESALVQWPVFIQVPSWLRRSQAAKIPRISPDSDARRSMHPVYLGVSGHFYNPRRLLHGEKSSTSRIYSLRESRDLVMKLTWAPDHFAVLDNEVQTLIHLQQLGKRGLVPEFVDMGQEAGLAPRYKFMITKRFNRFKTLEDVIIHNHRSSGGWWKRLLESTAKQQQIPLMRHLLQLEKMTAILTVVQSIHEAGVYHLDLKPSNIIESIDSPNEIKILDFDAAILSALAMNGGRGIQRGSPEYAAPEQLDESVGKLSAATDVYALGVILRQMLTGYMPVNVDTQGQTTILSSQELRDSLDELYLSDALKTILRKALAFNPADRYQNVSEMKAAIQLAQDELVSNIHQIKTYSLKFWLSRAGMTLTFMLANAQNVLGRVTQNGQEKGFFDGWSPGQMAVGIFIGIAVIIVLARAALNSYFGVNSLPKKKKKMGTRVTEAIRERATEKLHGKGNGKYKSMEFLSLLFFSHQYAPELAPFVMGSGMLVVAWMLLRPYFSNAKSVLQPSLKKIQPFLQSV